MPWNSRRRKKYEKRYEKLNEKLHHPKSDHWKGIHQPSKHEQLKYEKLSQKYRQGLGPQQPHPSKHAQWKQWQQTSTAKKPGPSTVDPKALTSTIPAMIEQLKVTLDKLGELMNPEEIEDAIKELDEMIAELEKKQDAKKEEGGRICPKCDRPGVFDNEDYICRRCRTGAVAA